MTSQSACSLDLDPLWGFPPSFQWVHVEPCVLSGFLYDKLKQHRECLKNTLRDLKHVMIDPAWLYTLRLVKHFGLKWYVADTFYGMGAQDRYSMSNAGRLYVRGQLVDLGNWTYSVFWQLTLHVAHDRYAAAPHQAALRWLDKITNDHPTLGKKWVDTSQSRVNQGDDRLAFKEARHPQTGGKSSSNMG